MSPGAVGRAYPRLEGKEKVTGTARYAVEYPVDEVTYGWAVPSAVVRGRITRIDTAEALASPGVLAVLHHGNAPRLAPGPQPEVWLLQEPAVHYRGEFIAVVVATSLEAAREGARLVRIDYDAGAHSTVLAADHPGLYRPDKVNPSYPTDTAEGDFDAGYAAAPVRVDVTYRTPAYHNNPMEPHATTAQWRDGRLLVHDSTQGASLVRATLADMFEMPPESIRVVAEHVGGGFGSKGYAKASVVLAALAARHVDRPVRLALTRQQLFGPIGYRTPIIQRVRLAADADGRLTAICHDAISQTSTVREFAEQTAVYTRSMYAAPHRRTTHRLVRLDVPTPFWMRAPGECPGAYALESAMDELAIAAGIDPVELRIRNDAQVDPDQGRPFTSRNLVACLREGAQRFGWADRDPTPRARRDGRWLIGTGVAGSSYPARNRPSSATATARPDGSFLVRINATDIGTGARTAVWQVAADALGVPPERVEIRIGDSDLPTAAVAGGSMGTASWSWAVIRAGQALREKLRNLPGDTPADEVTAEVSTDDEVGGQPTLPRYAYGAQFAEVRVDADTGEVRLNRMLGVFAAGRIVNPTTARSQLLGGMTMGLSMALHEEGLLDERYGDWVNHDLATYHITACPDVESIEAYWLDEQDDELNPAGVKGIGEIGIVGAAAAVANAVHHATGVRIRDLPIRLDKLVGVSALA
ncbi:xanthine dehydrogenase family protein molybdopterin-binding subunit [Micromonospora parathelypteridis]|uniref:Xanthine dehydrogenase YagR molybdenum-binding subunit n=1 Tax=Micromonospora parathelypteridis TaxID=1839617 RepID=A0A840VNF9_9ACTN|nr:xanthine dehydrogenase family protein molybdopterin-binding subunit [Micromonospora parathelypteridis]MBB5475584.1 xanthine dehydrogenase YagR molybdenum-binding subunit [Micromonospora parathelypteridis]GGO27556.1 xanthine dehydrogenase [Micromonospora parathelypteridis]